jgi:predicted nucleotidyltransferase
LKAKELPREVIDRLPKGLIFLCYRGSDSHGLKLPSDDPHSTDDTDLIGVYIENDSFYLGFGGKDSKEFWVGEYDVVLYEIRKFFHLLLKQNPNVLGTLWIDEKYVLLGRPDWYRIKDKRSMFASRATYHSFANYANSQLRRMTRQAKQTPQVKRELRLINEEIAWKEAFTGERGERTWLIHKYKDLSVKKLRERRNELRGESGYMGQKRRHLVQKYGYDCKNAAHLIRLLHMAVEFLQTGEMHVDRTHIDRDELLEVKTGQWPLEKVKEEAEKWFELAHDAYEKSTLPDQPDREGAEERLIDILWSHLLEKRSEVSFLQGYEDGF